MGMLSVRLVTLVCRLNVVSVGHTEILALGWRSEARTVIELTPPPPDPVKVVPAERTGAPLECTGVFSMNLFRIAVRCT